MNRYAAITASKLKKFLAYTGLHIKNVAFYRHVIPTDRRTP